MEPSEEETVMLGRDEDESEITAEAKEEVEETKEEPKEEPKEVVKEETKEDAKKEEPKEEIKEVKAEPKMVPLAALHEARAELSRFREKLAFVDDVKRQLDEIKAQKAQASVPKYEEDPLGNLDHRIKAEADRKAAIEAKIQQFEQQQQVQVMAQHVTSLENEFRKATPDYDKALSYLIDIRKSELEIIGVTDPNIVQGQIAKEANNISVIALQQGKNPAELAYQIAKKYGYKTEEPKVAPQKSQLEVVKQAQAATGKTLSKGGEPDVPPSAAAFASEKFNIFDPDFDKKWKELFGD